MSHAHEAPVVPSPLVAPLAHVTAAHGGYALGYDAVFQAPPPAKPGWHVHCDLSPATSPLGHDTASHVGGVAALSTNPSSHDPQWFS